MTKLMELLLLGTGSALLSGGSSYWLAWRRYRKLPTPHERPRDLMPALSRKHTTSPNNEGEDALDRAFREMDEGTPSLGHNNIFGLPPVARLPDPTPLTEAPLTTPKTPVPGHPCHHLSGEKPAHFQGNDCSGICQHSSQTGRVCFWPSQTASNCPVFTPKVMLTRVRLKPTGS